MRGNTRENSHRVANAVSKKANRERAKLERKINSIGVDNILKSNKITYEDNYIYILGKKVRKLDYIITNIEILKI